MAENNTNYKLPESLIRNMVNTSADFVHVVRCKDCKHWEYDAIFKDGWCRGRQQGNPNLFCADGERKDDTE